MPVTIQLNKTQHAGPKSLSLEAVNVMRAISIREHVKGSAVTQPGEIFAIMQGMGYTRENEKMNIQARAQEFANAIRRNLTAAKQQAPSYDEVIRVMGELGYQRSVAA
jgi:hypothetical protein